MRRIGFTVIVNGFKRNNNSYSRLITESIKSVNPNKIELTFLIFNLLGEI